MKILLLLTTALLLVLTGNAHASDATSWRCIAEGDAALRRQQVADQMQPRVVFDGEPADRGVVARMAAHHASALSVAVIHNGKLDWSAAWGRLDHDGAAADCSTLFQGGSLAKPTTLIAALRMQQAGVISLDAEVDSMLRSYHLPKGQQRPENPVTLRNLLRHTAGITPGGYAGYATGAALPTTTQILLGLSPANSRAIEVVAKPNEHLSYSGGGYTLIEAALQDRLRKPFDQLMQTWLLSPLGMRQASFVQPISEAHRGRTAKGHLADGSPVPGGWNNHPERAAAGLWTTPTDMATLLIELYQASRGLSATLDRELVEELLADPVEGHAYGFRWLGDGDDVFLTHYGGTTGYRAGMTINLRTGNGAVYLANSDGGSALGTEFLNSVSEVYDWTAFKTTSVKRSPKPRPVLESLVGLYDFPDSPTVRVVLEGEDLTLVFPNQDRYALTPIEGADLAFIHPATGVRVAFESEADHVSLHLYGEEGRRKR